jgi:hypothetical protein
MLPPSDFHPRTTSYSRLATTPRALSSFILHTSYFFPLPLNPKIPKMCEYVGLTLSH